MRIAFIVTSFPHLSSTPVLKQITGALDRGHEVDIYADRPGDTTALHPDVNRYKLLDRTHYPNMPGSLTLRIIKGALLFLRHVWGHPLLLLKLINVFRYGELAASLVLLYGAIPLLSRKSYDIIHCQFGPNGLKGMCFRECGLINGKVITTFRGYDVTSYPRRRGTKVYRRLFQKGDLFTANSRFLAEKARALGCPPERLLDLHTGVDLSKFTYSHNQFEPGDSVRILTVGRLFEVKGVEYGIRAVAEVLRMFPRVRYQIAGDGPLLEQLRKLAGDLGITQHVEFLGGQTENQIIDLYAHAHIFLLPGVTARGGDEEGQGGVLAEAQATGLPVVASRVGGIPEAILDGRSGFLVPQREVTALAAKLTYLIRHPQLWDQMGRAGREHVEQHYDLEKLNDRLVEIYDRLLDGSLPGGLP